MKCYQSSNIKSGSCCRLSHRTIGIHI